MNPESYATALWTLVEKGHAPREAVTQLRKSLEHHGRTALLPKIGLAFARIAERKLATEQTRIFVADEKDAKHAVKEAVELCNLPNGDMDVYVEKELIGGWRLEGRGQLVDNSFKSHLLSIYNHATR